jgi:hypothetical protein
VFIRGHKRSEVRNEQRDIFERRLLVFLEGSTERTESDLAALSEAEEQGADSA